MSAAAPGTFRSIRGRLMVSTTVLLVVVLVGVMVAWAVRERRELRTVRAMMARTLVRGMQSDIESQLLEGNWARLRLDCEVAMLHNPEVVYALVSDHRAGDKIVGAAPGSLQQGVVPDMVPVWVTDRALAPGVGVRTAESFLLRDLEFPEGHRRARAGERILETAITLEGGDSRVRQAGTLRVGISLRDLDEATWRVMQQVLLIGALAILCGLAGAYVVARRISRPIVELTRSTRVIAAGDLRHRASVSRSDEIGALAHDFNEMATHLQTSFDRLQATLRSVERFVPRKFLNVIAPQGIEHMTEGNAAMKRITILFSDIRGYTTLSERLTPMEIFDLLNEYLARLGAAIEEHGGFIDKYIGDAIMALFEDEASDGAVAAALGMRRALADYNRSRTQRGLERIDIGVGLHHGPVVMGALGFHDHIDPTVIGDAVNVASRVEGATKQFGAPILITREVVNSLRHPERFRLELVASGVKLKGKDGGVDLYAVLEPEAE